MAAIQSRHVHDWRQIVAGHDPYEAGYKKFKTLWRCDCGEFKWGDLQLTPITIKLAASIDTQAR